MEAKPREKVLKFLKFFISKHNMGTRSIRNQKPYVKGPTWAILPKWSMPVRPTSDIINSERNVQRKLIWFNIDGLV